MTDRDLQGYGRNPPHPRWPDDARIALNFVFNVEEGSEQSVGDGDSEHEVHLTEVTASPVPPGARWSVKIYPQRPNTTVSRWLSRIEQPVPMINPDKQACAPAPMPGLPPLRWRP